MALNTALWKEKTKENLGGWKKRFDKAGANSTYYFLSAISFAPIIQAVHSGDWGALSLLGMTLGGAVGTNLLANMVQNLKGKSDGEVAEALATKIQAEPDLKDALDALLENLEALQEAEYALPDDDKRWFTETIQQELKELRSGVTYEYNTTRIGDGAIAQNSSVSLGQGATVHGSIVINSEKKEEPVQKTQKEPRVVDAAISKQVVVGQTTKLLAMVRQTRSKGLVAVLELEGHREITEENIKSKPFSIDFPILSTTGELQPAEILVKIVSPDFKQMTQQRKILIPVDGDSDIHTFLLTPEKPGLLLINFEIYKDDISLISRVLETTGVQKAATDNETFVISIPLAIMATKSGAIYSANIQGDGAIAQGDGAIALGAGAKYIGGDYNEAPDPAKAEEASEKAARENYLASLYRRCQSLPLVALGDDPNAREDVTLDDVYIDLHTTKRIDIEKGAEKEEHGFRSAKQKPLTAFDAFLKTQKMVLLGDPGSGKSTFVRNLLAMQAQVLRGKAEALEGVAPNLLPILVTLRDLIGSLNKLNYKKMSAERRDAQLVDLVDAQIISDMKELYRTPAFGDGIRKSLVDGRVLLVFDGLDEVPERLREKIRLAVTAYQKAYDLPRIIVTCRIRSYRGAAEQPGFTPFTLAPFTQKQAQNFSQAWYDSQVRLGKMAAEAANEQAKDLARAAWRDELQKLAENPMLLTTMAIIHQKETRLPDQRVKLYSQAVRVLTKRWQEHRFGEELAVSEGLAAILKNDKHIRKILERLAYEAHRIGKKNGKKTEADLLRKDAIEILEASAYLGNMNLASELLDYIDLRSGLLVGRGGEPGKPSAYSFAHRTFQEYLAGCYLVNHRDKKRLISALAAEPEYWSLALEFGAEDLYYNGRTESQNDVLDLAYDLLGERYKEEKYSRTALWSAKMATLVGVKTIKNDISPNGGEGYLKRIIVSTTWLLKSNLTPVERADAGRALSKLGDPRPALMDVDALELSFVPAGKFWMGSKKNEGDSDERPQHKLDLPAFWMGRYPVTNAQYQVFIEEGGYSKKEFWKEAQDANVWVDGRVKGRNDDVPREAANDFGEPYNLSNHPVVGINWYEMLAFTRWLDLRWHEQGVLGNKWQVTLPSEAEWEKAARGGIHIPEEAIIQIAKTCRWNWQLESKKEFQNPEPQRAYPWGDEFNLNKANASATGIGTTSTVGSFTEGQSPYGLQELSGNVWEWTRSLWDKNYPYPESGKDLAERENLAAETNTPRVLRGGSFYYDRSGVRCAARIRNYPYRWFNNIGFRLVVSPSSSY
jgi:formylglycine-generating enzyme required for sulfatase activity